MAIKSEPKIKIRSQKVVKGQESPKGQEPLKGIDWQPNEVTLSSIIVVAALFLFLRRLHRRLRRVLKFSGAKLSPPSKAQVKYYEGPIHGRRQSQSRPGPVITDDGYVGRRSVFGRFKLQHREVAEDILGRPLERDEVVHHINGKRADNRPSNLCVMTRWDHDRYHDWYDWIYKEYGKYPRRETQLRKLRGDFKGTLLSDFLKRRSG